MQSETRELEQLPLEDLITAPLNAVITAQANAALSTAPATNGGTLMPVRK